ncbi:hypothetical protein Y032_0023g855 [Ancylostoma ceylanicum]|uniref:Uncharacterized protein n=1 Tax=Ancylostoma ceylanicum TaxID=53326 RepID=A0A016UXG2_9BILA|nr:hypothetical protein Y032_0023g855 [Ancylostoma ceylanicum]
MAFTSVEIDSTKAHWQLLLSFRLPLCFRWDFMDFALEISKRVQILIWRGDGCIVVGETPEEAVYLMRNLVSACDHQV